MKSQSEMNKEAWSYRAYEFWEKNYGLPCVIGKEMAKQPEKYLRDHLEFLGEVKGKKIANILGSNGRRAIPLALLGADVTVMDISLENQKYALELAKEAGVDIGFILGDFLELEVSKVKESFDIAYLERGVIHYFEDLKVFANKVYELLKLGGRLILNDFHPFRKILNCKDIYTWDESNLEIVDDYFESQMKVGNVAYKKYFSEEEQKSFPDVLLRYYTIGEIISAFSSAGFIIEDFMEVPVGKKYGNLPGEFVLLGSKYIIKK